MRHVSRSSSKNISDTNDRRTIDHAEGKMEWDTKRFRRDKSWKLYRRSQLKRVIENEEPKKCCKCGSTDIRFITLDSVENIICEMEARCNDCDEYLGLWSYGFWE